MSMDMQEQVARIQRMQEETRKFAAEMHKLTDETRTTGGLLGLQIALAGTFTGAALVFIMAWAMIKVRPAVTPQRFRGGASAASCGSAYAPANGFGFGINENTRCFNRCDGIRALRICADGSP
jgi:hypothetical protein